LFKAPDSFGRFEVKLFAGWFFTSKFEAETSMFEMRNFNQKSSSLLANELLAFIVALLLRVLKHMTIRRLA
jgi:hypothetical protein